LEKLFLSYNSLLHLPESLVQLENLTDLVVNHNPLQELPGDIGRLKKLQKLILNNTNISSLPESLNDCVVLNTLNIRSCKYLTYFPSLQDIGSFSEIRNDYSGYYISQLNLE
jgi:Leucine-rich repeat (LRR) protein